MSEERDIKNAIREIAGSFTDQVSVYVCSVDSVNIDERTCDCTIISGDADNQIPSVQLSSEPNDGFIIEPEVGSTVIVGLTIRSTPFVMMFSEVKNVYLTASQKITFNTGNFGGLIKVEQLVSKLNALENKVNSLIGKFNSHTHTGVTTGAGTSGTTATQELGTLSNTARADIENDKIIHG